MIQKKNRLHKILCSIMSVFLINISTLITINAATHEKARPTLSYSKPTETRPASTRPTISNQKPSQTPNNVVSPTSNSSKVWALWNHANGDNSLAEFINYNASNMAKANLNDSTLVLIQADRPNDIGTYRYRVTKGKVTLIDHLSYEMGQQPGKEIIDGIKWLNDNYSYTNLILNLWGHGSGPMDPQIRRLRGILFDDTNLTYLNNQDFSKVVDSIAALRGKNIEIVGTDACLMGSLEICWQIRNSVDILVASETTEPGTGWDYAPFLNTMASKKNITAPEVASAIVKAYGSYYKKGLDPYTLSAINLKLLNPIIQSMHAVIDKIKICMEKDARAILVALMSARALSLQMDESSYVDFSDFLTQLADQLRRVKVRSFNEKTALELDIHNDIDIIVENSRTVVSDVIAYFSDSTETKAFKDDINLLITAIDTTIKTIKNAVIANTAGNTMNRAQGMTIYFPPIHAVIHESYPKTKFAQETRWMNDFLLKIMGYTLA